jgi:hypothetical protein
MVFENTVLKRTLEPNFEEERGARRNGEMRMLPLSKYYLGV